MRPGTFAALACITVMLSAAVPGYLAAEDGNSRRMCLALLARAVATKGEPLSGFMSPRLAIPAHTFRATESALHCLFLSGDNELLYGAANRGKMIAFKLQVVEVFDIE